MNLNTEVLQAEYSSGASRPWLLPVSGGCPRPPAPGPQPRDSQYLRRKIWLWTLHSGLRMGSMSLFSCHPFPLAVSAGIMDAFYQQVGSSLSWTRILEPLGPWPHSIVWAISWDSPDSTLIWRLLIFLSSTPAACWDFNNYLLNFILI